MFKAMCDSAGKPTVIGTYVKNGTSLKDNTQDQDCLNKIASREWDYVIGIDAGPGVAYPQQYSAEMSYLAALSMRNLTQDANDSGRFVWVMPWAFEDGMLWAGWEDDFSRMQQKIYVNSINWARGQDYTVAPVGWAWLHALDSLNFPLHYLHTSDWSHPSPKGSYLMCCVLYCTVFQDTCDNDHYAGLPQAEAEWYQRLATEIVLENPDLWYLPTIETSTRLSTSPPHRFSMECYPNPFNPAIAVSMELTFAQGYGESGYGVGSNTAVKIYDISGRLVKILYDGYLDADKHTFHWNASDVPAGVYVVRAQAGRDVQTRKIVYLP